MGKELELASRKELCSVIGEWQHGGAGPSPAKGRVTLPTCSLGSLTAEVVLTVFNFAESLLRLEKGNEPLPNSNAFCNRN